MPNYQTECLRVITIGYLKSFIGDEVQNSSNGSSIHVNYSDDTYCPTYAELTGGTFIQNWQQGSTPNGDRDGIVVNTTCTGTGSAYANNQLVNQKDLSMKYTRFRTFTIGHTGSPVDECGGNVSISYTHQYTRYNKSMANDCTVSTTSATASDTANNEISFSAGCGWVHPQVGTSSVDAQPSNRTAAARSCTVTGSISFRGTSHSDTTTVSQDALTGSYSNYEGRHYTSVTARATTSTSFTGCGSHSFGASATGYYYDRYEWKDSCGHVYHSSPYDDINGSESAGSQSGSFSEVSCPTTTCNESKSLSFSYHGHSDSVSFSRTGSNSCGCSKPTVWEDYDCTAHPGETLTVNGTAYTNCSQDAQGNCNCTTASTSMTVSCPSGCDCNSLTVENGICGSAGGSGIVLAYYTGACLTNVAATASESWITSVGVNTSDKTITGNVSSNNSSIRTATITVTATECTAGKSVTFTQDKPTDWSEKLCNNACGHNYIMEDSPYELRKNGSSRWTGDWYVYDSAGAMSYTIEYLESSTTGWITTFETITDASDRRTIWNNILNSGGYYVNNALQHVFPGWNRGWNPGWNAGYVVPFKITGTENNSGIERHAKVHLYMNGVYTGQYMYVYQTSNPVTTCPDTQDVVVQTSSMQGVPSTGATITDGVKFYTGHTSFTSTGSITDLNNVTSATWGSDAGSGWKWLNITVPANSTSSSRSCSFTINMNTSNGTCSYPITFTQQAGGNFTINVTINKPAGVTSHAPTELTIGTTKGTYNDDNYGGDWDISHAITLPSSLSGGSITSVTVVDADASHTSYSCNWTPSTALAQGNSYTFSSTSCVAGNYTYRINVSNPPVAGIFTDNFRVYICDQPVSTVLKTQGLLTNGTSLGIGPGVVTACQFEVDSSGSFVRIVNGNGIVNKVLDDGSVTKQNFAADHGYYLCCVQTNDYTKFYQYGTQPDLRTSTDVSCRDYTQNITS